ncbi:hypothetical protein THAOC_15348 [Thalassiosira oceanica]|uniref:B30.2/SPRY domain-containing protein n=1 Tax=Thalassiosira oceanica TaxID=159749 RepID=K0T0F6_THAOC|nr:hypothetical protein THAOC_15348 [Thalassiosira oceanica]|eukprot:EJK63967.1 hypothetical protein THAOC_15348 [Thalassiosira oceanica]
MPGLDANEYETFSFIQVPELYPDFLDRRSDDWGDGNVHACEYWAYNGQTYWANWANSQEEEDESFVESWEGMESCMTGDTVGMLFNLDEGTLSVYKNNRRLGIMKDGLLGPYCWYVVVADRIDAVAIKEAQIPRDQSSIEQSSTMTSAEL